MSAASYESQPISIHSTPTLYHSVAYVNQQQPQHQQNFFEMREHQIPPTMYLQSNQHSYLTNASVYQQQSAIPQVYQCQDYLQYPGMFSQPFAAHSFTTRTALARGCGNSSTLLKSDSELTVSCVQ